MNVELHLRDENQGAKLYEITVDGKAFLGIVGDDTALQVLVWDESGEAHTVWDTTPDDLYDPDEPYVQTTGTYNPQTEVFTPHEETT